MKNISKIFKKKTNTSSREISQKMGLYEGWTARTIFNLSSGAFMAGYLQYLGINKGISGKIMALPVLAAMIQFISPIIIENLNWKKKLVLIGCTIHRLLLFSMILIPFIPVSLDSKIIVVGIIYFLSFLSVSFITPAVTNMYMRFVPSDVRGTYFGKRESGILLFSTIITLGVGKILDIYKNLNDQSTGYLILYAIIFLITCLNIMSFFFMREFREKPSVIKFKVKDVFIIPIKDKKFRSMIILFFLWIVGIQFGAAYFGIYMVTELELTYTFITICGLFSATLYLIFAPKWGKFADKFGWTKTVMLTFLVLGIDHLLWIFVYKSASYMYILVLFLHALGGVAWSGLNMAMFNIQFDYMPNKNKTLYLGFNAALSGIIGFGVAFLSSAFVGTFGDWRTTFLGIEIGIIQIILSISGILILCASLYAKKILSTNASHRLFL